MLGRKKVLPNDSDDELNLESTIDIETTKNPIVGKPAGHEKYSDKDIDQCPVMSGKVKPPAKDESKEDEEEYSSSSDEDDEAQVEMPKGHEGFSEADKEKCPVMSGKIPAPAADGAKKKKKKKPQGGCPFMPTDSKKAPALELYEASYEIPYVSTLRHLFSFRGLLARDKANRDENTREKFEKYPIFLKHTLFHNEEKFEKIRKLEVAHRFFVYDKFREQGNKKFNRNKTADAIPLYEHALSCFKWLEMKEPEKKEEEKGEEEMKYDPLENIRGVNKALCSILSDDNVECHDGEDVQDANEKDMRNSMLLNIYLALGCCYIKLNHYSTALEALEEGFSLNPGSSQLYFRRSQARAYNLDSSMEDLQKAKDDIAKAIEIKHYEKVFQSEPGILKILNIHNANEVYLEHAHYVEKRIKERQEEERTAIRFLFSRLKEVEKIEKEMLKSGRIPFDNDEDDNGVEIKEEENMEFDVVKEMNSKYVKVIEFYLETEKKDQVALARKEVQGTLDIHHKMKIYLDLNFKTWESNPLIVECLKEYEDIDLTKPKILKRLDNFRINKAKEIFESAKFNMEMFQYAVKEYFKRKEEIEKRKKEEEDEEKGLDEKPSRGWFSSIFGFEFGIQIFIIILLFALFWYFNKNSLFGSKTK